MGNDYLRRRRMGRGVPRATAGNLPEQVFLRTGDTGRQGRQSEDYGDLLPSSVLSLNSSWQAASWALARSIPSRKAK